MNRSILNLATRLTLCSKSFIRASSSKGKKMEHLQENPFYAKYAARLQQKKEENPEDFAAGLKHIEAEHKRQQELEKQQMEEEKKQLAEKAAKRQEEGLNAVMRVELLENESPEHITEIWSEYHKHKDAVYAVIDHEEYDEIQKKAKEHGTFVYPLPRGEGYDFFLQQFKGNEIHFTPLIQYQTHGENAPGCLTLNHYTEFKDTKGVVLMVGEPDTKVLSVLESQLLAMQVKMYYGHQSAMKFNLVRQMNSAPSTFNHLDLITQFENYKKDCRTAEIERK